MGPGDKGGMGVIKHSGAAPAGAVPAHPSLRASIAAGLHQTLNLIWRPQDIDHPEDEFLPKAQAEAALAAGGASQALAPAPSAPHRSLSGSTSGSCDSSSGGAGGHAAPVGPLQPFQQSHNGRRGVAGGDLASGATPPASSGRIAAVRHRAATPATAPRTPIVARRPPQVPEVDYMFRPLGSGMSFVNRDSGS